MALYGHADAASDQKLSSANAGLEQDGDCAEQTSGNHQFGSIVSRPGP